MGISKKELTHKELETVVGGGPAISIGGDIIKVANEAFTGICSLIDGWNKKKYRGKC